MPHFSEFTLPLSSSISSVALFSYFAPSLLFLPTIPSACKYFQDFFLRWREFTFTLHIFSLLLTTFVKSFLYYHFFTLCNLSTTPAYQLKLLLFNSYALITKSHYFSFLFLCDFFRVFDIFDNSFLKLFSSTSLKLLPTFFQTSFLATPLFHYFFFLQLFWPLSFLGP